MSAYKSGGFSLFRESLKLLGLAGSVSDHNVAMVGESGANEMVFFEVIIDDFLILKSSEKGTKFVVEGRIQDVSSLWITLTDIRSIHKLP